MGYNTHYRLETDQDMEEHLNILADLRNNNDSAEYALDYQGDSYESVKWYDHDNDLIEFSKKYPKVLFTLTGEGEEAGDLWKSYFRNGKLQTAHAKITYDKPEI